MAPAGKDALSAPGVAIERWLALQSWTAPLRDTAGGRGERAFLVGGALRDVLLGGAPADVDLAIEGDAPGLARELDPEARVHERFGTARLALGGVRLDLASTRSETYPEPGALPVVSEAPIEADLDRRDFTVNAIAAPLDDPAKLIDPHGGLIDLAGSRLSILHDASLRDDPTRALRAARFAARLRFGISELTAARIGEARLDTISAERVEAELAAILGESAPVSALALARTWGLLDADLERVGSVLELAGRGPWRDLSAMPAALDAGEVRAGRAVWATPPRSLALAALEETRPSELSRAARGASAEELAIALLLGTEWVERYVAEWRAVRLGIGGSDLIAAGIEPGPAIGAGLEAALAARIDDPSLTSSDELELELALAAARAASA